MSRAPLRNLNADPSTAHRLLAVTSTSTSSPVNLAMRPKSHNNHNAPFPSHDRFSSSSAHHIFLKADKKVIESVNKRIDKLVHLCQHPRIQLRNSPPYLLDILPDISEKLKAIVSNYQGALEELFNTLYFQVFLRNLIEKCKLTSRLFKEAKELMYDERSEYRRRLIKYSLVFSHILKDLEALYPNDRFSPASFRITKKEAADWWYNNFERSPIIPWEMFREALFQSFEVTDPSHMRELQSTIDLTCNDFVSVFEFDVFVRLFQPWNNVIETWKALAMTHAGYMAFMTYDEVKAVLKKFRGHPGPGSYVYRLSCTKLGQWAIGYITHDLHILQTIIQNKSLAQALIDGERDGFYLYPNGTPSQSSILMPLVRNLPRAHVKVSQEQHDLYYRIGSTFELCKICTENNKDVRLEPCNHLLCKSCLHNCLGTGQTCPFCRMEVKSIEDIVLDPFVSDHSSFDEDNDAERTVFPTSEGGEDIGDVDEEPRFQDRAIGADPAPGLFTSTSTGVNLETSSTGTATSEEGVAASPRRRRNPSSCCSRTTDLDLQTREGEAAINMDPIAFMQRSDVAQVVGGPPLTADVAKQLLETCDGNADIAARVWRHFMPRP